MDNTKQTACLFGGHGSQYIGMGKAYYEIDKDCREIFEIASNVMGYDMAEFCFYGDEEKLSQTLYSLPSLLTIELCEYTLTIKEGYKFGAYAGFSLGEYAALAASRVVSIPTAFELLKNMLIVGDSVLQDNDYSMSVINLPPEICENICLNVNRGSGKGIVKIANYNSPKQVTVAGNIQGLESFMELAKDLKGKIIPLNVYRPFHSDLMISVFPTIKKEVENYSYSLPIAPLYMNATGESVSTIEDIKSNISRHFIYPVLWSTTLNNMHTKGIQQYFEYGSKGALCRMVKDNLNIDKSQTAFFKPLRITT